MESVALISCQSVTNITSFSQIKKLFLNLLVTPLGLEPRTYGLKGRYSTS